MRSDENIVIKVNTQRDSVVKGTVLLTLKLAPVKFILVIYGKIKTGYLNGSVTLNINALQDHLRRFLIEYLTSACYLSV